MQTGKYDGRHLHRPSTRAYHLFDLDGKPRLVFPRCHSVWDCVHQNTAKVGIEVASSWKPFLASLRLKICP